MLGEVDANVGLEVFGDFGDDLFQRQHAAVAHEGRGSGSRGSGAIGLLVQQWTVLLLDRDLEGWHSVLTQLAAIGAEALRGREEAELVGGDGHGQVDGEELLFDLLGLGHIVGSGVAIDEEGAVFGVGAGAVIPLPHPWELAAGEVQFARGAAEEPIFGQLDDILARLDVDGLDRARYGFEVYHHLGGVVTDPLQSVPAQFPGRDLRVGGDADQSAERK